MACFIITYDLRHHATFRNYAELEKAIKAFTWAKVNLSTWAVLSDGTAEQIADSLLPHIHAQDRLFVIRSGRDATWLNAECGDDWLQKNL